MKAANEILIKKNPKIKGLLDKLDVKEEELKSPIEEIKAKTGEDFEKSMIHNIGPFKTFWRKSRNEKFIKVEQKNEITFPTVTGQVDIKALKRSAQDSP